jgi:hypothetical protein
MLIISDFLQNNWRFRNCEFKQFDYWAVDLSLRNGARIYLRTDGRTNEQTKQIHKKHPLELL